MGASKNLKSSPTISQAPAKPQLPNYSQAGFYQGSPEPIDSSGMPYPQAMPQAEPIRMAKAPAGKRQAMSGGQPYCPC